MTSQDVEDKVDAWHNSNSLLPLHEYLGWTKEQYTTWIEQGELPTTTLCLLTHTKT